MTLGQAGWEGLEILSSKPLDGDTCSNVNDKAHPGSPSTATLSVGRRQHGRRRCQAWQCLNRVCERSGVDCTALGGARVKVFKTTVLDAEPERQILFMWCGSYTQFFRRCQVHFICNNGGGRENHFQMSNCAFCSMPGIGRTVLISRTGICLKVAFDLNFNLQTEAGEKDPFILFQQRSKTSCSRATVYHHWWGGAVVWLLTWWFQAFVLVKRQRGNCCFCLGVNHCFPSSELHKQPALPSPRTKAELSENTFQGHPRAKTQFSFSNVLISSGNIEALRKHQYSYIHYWNIQLYKTLFIFTLRVMDHLDPEPLIRITMEQQRRHNSAKASNICDNIFGPLPPHVGTDVFLFKKLW